jgi:hypothetical protein
MNLTTSITVVPRAIKTVIIGVCVIDYFPVLSEGFLG